MVEFPSERELLFLVNWLLFVSGREWSFPERESYYFW